MVSGAVLGAVAGFASALVMVAIPVLGFGYRLDKQVQRLLTLVEGQDKTDQPDGLLPRLQRVEETLRRAETVEFRADGGRSGGGESE